MNKNGVTEFSAVALQRTDQFVGRTTNWLYDHLRSVPRHKLVVLCDTLMNREEFPLLEARLFLDRTLGSRIWHRLWGDRMYPPRKRWLQHLAPKILHSHFGYVAANDLAFAEYVNVPWIVSFYGADVYKLGRLDQWRKVYGEVFQRAAKVLALGPVMAEQLRTLGCPSSKIMIHPLGVDVDSIPDKPRVLEHGEPLRILYAGAFKAKKGIRYVVEAAGRARKAGVKLQLYLIGDEGDGYEDREPKDQIFCEIDRLDLNEQTTYHSFLTFQELINLALSCHVFVGPSVTAENGDAEGTPFVLQQMMATGMPCIATEHTDIPFLFGDLRHMLVPERDAEAIADRIGRYVKEPSMLVKDGANLRQRIRKAVDVRSCAARLSDLYDSVLELQCK
jgi:colanic acid/amylovoran biosynthesis glycosyltransferase